ncbi:MAG TPA: phage tail protein [Candidatus Limnocylindrales bacterium]|nr:phage tail protein [Candidatus Limnocylindrales bacterium]
MSDDLNVRYLNLENAWPQFVLSGLLRQADGSLALPVVPAAASPSLPTGALGAFEGPAGIGVDAAGNVYVSDTAGHRVLRIDGCDGTTAPVAGLSGPGSDPGHLDGPRGVIVGPRGALYVCDSGNDRIQVVDLATGQLRGIWGQPNPWGPPQPGTDPGRLDDPWDLAADSAGRVYVVDHGNHRVQRFDASGAVEAGFWSALSAQPVVPAEPAAATVTLVDGDERLLVVDRTGPKVVAYALDGTYDAATSEAWSDLGVPDVDGVAYADGVLYVSQPSLGRILAFDASGVLIGTVAGVAGGVGPLVLDPQGRLLVHPGTGGTGVAVLGPGAAYAVSGSFLAGPFSVTDRATRWDRLRIRAEPLGSASHVTIATLTSDSAASPGFNPASIDPATAVDQAVTPQDVWRAAPRDALDLLVLNEPGRYLWIGGVLEGDGSATPRIHQMRLSYDHESYLRHLPALYERGDESGFLRRVLELIESEFGDAEESVDRLPALFDPAAAPADGGQASWLAWLAGWLAFDLVEAWPEGDRRDAVAGAFELSGARGTIDGLRRYVKLYTGADVRIEEPARTAALWSLGETSVLGFTTMLAPSESQGATLGSTAVLDHSHVMTADHDTPQLFDDLAHRFRVEAYEADLPTAELQAAVRAVIDREKPAHTDYDLCLIGARMRVGRQARLGIDTIVAGPPAPLVLDDAVRLGIDGVLPQLPANRARLVGEARVGSSTLS